MDCLITNINVMIRFKFLILFLLVFAASMAFGQDEYQIQTVFKPGHRASGGYAAVSNKFTTIGDQYANMVELYGGWFINHRFLVGLQVAALTNDIKVPTEFSTSPDLDMSYQFGQFGLMTEYTLCVTPCHSPDIPRYGRRRFYSAVSKAQLGRWR